MKKTPVFIATVLLLLLFATPAYAVPALPHAFYGSVTINGVTATDGTRISATVSGRTVITNAQNPVTTVGGSYGINSPYLLVQGDIPDGATITFNVTNNSGTATGGTALFEAGGGPTRHDISVTIQIASGGGGGGGGGSTVPTSFFGTTGSLTTDSTGTIQTTVTATSADGKLSVTFPAGTKALDKNGNPLTTLTININTSPPAPPAGANVIGLAYNFGPDGATFAPPITITCTYDPNTLPAGVAEQDLVVAYYDATAGAWVELPGTVNTTTHTITVPVSHFTTFAIIGKAKLAPAPTPTPTPSPKPTLTPTPTSSPTPTPTPSPLPTPTPTPSPSPTPTPPPAPSLNWLLIGGIIAAVIIVVLIILFIARRRSSY